MDIQSLEAFLAVADAGSFSRAAESLHLTQPAVSKRIANLEAQLSSKLFDRIGRDVYLTEAGNLLAVRARKILDDIQDTQTAVERLDDRLIKQLNIGSSQHIGLTYLGPLLKQFQRQYPKALIDVEFLESEEAIDRLQHRHIELALSTIPSPLPRELTAERIWREELVFVVSADHPLAKARGKLRLNQLASYPALVPDPESTTYAILEQTFHRHHIPIKRMLKVNYLATIQALVSHGLGWALLPISMLTDDLRALPIERVALHRDLGLLRHRQRTLSAGAQYFVQLVQQQRENPTSTTP